MAQMTVRQTSAELPALGEEDLELVSSVDGAGGLVSGFQFGATSLPEFDLVNVGLVQGRIRALRAGRASVTGARLSSVEFSGCDLSSLRWAGGKLSRVWFDSCRLLGARFIEVSAEHVVFTGCKLDYSVFEHVRVTGPVLFAGCSLREAEFTSCDLTGSLLDDCDLRLTEFGRGSYRRCDLRGNDLSAVIGAHHLRHAVIDHAQMVQLAGALAAELDLTFGDETPDQP
jgi:uncharacterized protein YjbI with pentapeptide repeats